MKCAICGKEFGNGSNCQSCGTDRVSGLGKYRGFDSKSFRGEERDNQDTPPPPPQSNSIICWKCGEIIPVDAKYCPFCETALYVNCPKCGHLYESRFPACPNCGTNREVYLEEQKKKAEQERIRREQEEKKQKEREDHERLIRELREREAEREQKLQAEMEEEARKLHNKVFSSSEVKQAIVVLEYCSKKSYKTNKVYKGVFVCLIVLCLLELASVLSSVLQGGGASLLYLTIFSVLLIIAIILRKRNLVPDEKKFHNVLKESFFQDTTLQKNPILLYIETRNLVVVGDQEYIKGYLFRLVTETKELKHLIKE